MSIELLLNEYLRPIEIYLTDPFISEISINNAYEIFYEKKGVTHQQSIPEFNNFHLQGLTQLIATASQQRLSRQEPLLSAALPNGHRIQIVLPPACDVNQIIISIRKSTANHFSLDDYIAKDAFKCTKAFLIPEAKPLLVSTDSDDEILKNLFSDANYGEFLKKSIQLKKNIIIAGGTNTGKTTLLNACLKQIPLHERIITLEDVREIHLPHANKAHLMASRGNQSTASLKMKDLIQACVRLRPDRIIFGEIRGDEAFDFCNALMTGHEGSIASIHATHPSMVFSRLIYLIQQSGACQLSFDDLWRILVELIDVIIQLKVSVSTNNLQRYVGHIYYKQY